MKNCLSLLDFSSEELESCLRLAAQIKANPIAYHNHLAGKTVATLYEKPSLRTRVTFEVGIQKLGGQAIYLDLQNEAMGQRETIEDFAANLSLWTDAIVARVKDHSTLLKLRAAATVPIINALCDRYHPCQALADVLTLKEYYRDLSTVHLAYVGDGNNVAHSLLHAAALLGFSMTVVTPSGREVNADIWKEVQAQAGRHHKNTLNKGTAAKAGMHLQQSNALSALAGAHVLYTDTWVSMGDTRPLSLVKDLFMPYQVNAQLMMTYGIQHFMHCAPIHREYEVTNEVVDSSTSLVLAQARNRLWAQCALLVHMLREY